MNDCLFDEEIPVNKNGFYTIAISRVEDRPRNANKECGYAWLPMADDGDGMFDEDVTIIQFRHMLPSKNFQHSIQRVMPATPRPNKTMLIPMSLSATMMG